MIQDEFNQIEVKNEKQIEKAEFGHVQKSEYSENGDMGLGKRAKAPNLNQSSPTKGTEVTTTTASSAASSTSSSATAIAATSTSAVVVASTVAIGAISVATGISVALHDYQVQFKSLIISANELSYSLVIDDLKFDRTKEYDYDDHQKFEEDLLKNTFNLRVYNSNYDKTEEVYLFYENSGTFSGLTLGQTYNIVISENRYGGKTLYEESFTTSLNSTFLDFYLENSYDSLNNEIYVTLDYIDELDRFSDFKLTLERDEHELIELPIEKSQGRQVVNAHSLNQERIEAGVEYYYTFSYMDNDKEVDYQKGEIAFYDISEARSEFYSFIFDKTADFVTGEFEVTLDFRDDLDIYSNFALSFLSTNVATTVPEAIEIPLEKTTETQIINGFDYDLVYVDTTYECTLTCLQDDETINLYNEEVTFTDLYNRKSEFYRFDFDKKADFTTGECTVTLNYEDSFNYFSNFELVFVEMNPESSEEYTINIDLEKTGEPQTISLNEYGIDYRNREYSYELRVQNKGSVEVLDSGTVRFTDLYDREGKFNAFTFTGEANFINRTFDVTLDYDDPFNDYDEFILTMYMGPDDEDGIEIPLQSVSKVKQTISCENYDINLKFTPYTYSLSCMYMGEKLILDSGEVTFTDTSGAVVEFTGLDFDKKANFDTREFTLKLNYQDDLDDLYGFKFTLTDLDTNEVLELDLDKTTDEQTFVVNETIESQDGGDPIYKLDITEDQMSYRFEYYNDGELIVPVEGEEFYFENSLVSTFDGVDTNYDFIQEPTGAYTFPIKFNYDDAAHIYDYFSVSIRTGSGLDSEVAADLMFEGDNVNKNWQYAAPSYSEEVKDITTLCDMDGLYLVVSYFPRETPRNPNPEETVLFSKQANFTYGQTSPTIFGASIRNEGMITAGDYSIDVQPVYAGNTSDFEAEIIVETKSGKKYRMVYRMPSIGNYAGVSLFDSNEDQIDEETIDAELEEGVDIYLRYCTLTYDTSGGADAPTVIRSEYITLTLGTNYKFVVSH